MNWNQAKGNSNQFMGKAKAKWGDLTDDELTQIAGERDALVGLIQTKYGILQEAAEQQVKEWEKGHEIKDWETSHS
ncbi:MAG: CsbD family protein [Chromatiaceae bacterium]